MTAKNNLPSATVRNALRSEVFGYAPRWDLLERRFLGRPDFAPWDRAALDKVYFGLVRRRYLSVPSRAALFLAAAGPGRGLQGRRLDKLLACVEFAGASQKASQDYALMRGERAKLGSRGIFLMISSLTSAGIAGCLISEAGKDLPVGRRLAALKALTDALNRHILRLASTLADAAPPPGGEEALLLAERLLDIFSAAGGLPDTHSRPERLALELPKRSRAKTRAIIQKEI